MRAAPKFGAHRGYGPPLTDSQHVWSQQASLRVTGNTFLKLACRGCDFSSKWVELQTPLIQAPSKWPSRVVWVAVAGSGLFRQWLATKKSNHRNLLKIKSCWWLTITSDIVGWSFCHPCFKRLCRVKQLYKLCVNASWSVSSCFLPASQNEATGKEQTHLSTEKRLKHQLEHKFNWHLLLKLCKMLCLWKEVAESLQRQHTTVYV